MYVFDEDDIRRLFSNFTRYLETSYAENSMKKISRELKKYFSENLGDSSEIFDRKICSLVELINNPTKKYSVIILKNKNELFDMFIFENEVSVALDNLASSESLEDMIRRNPTDGCVIENASSDDVLVFLKSYYIYRKEPPLSTTALNMVPEYNFDCFEMTSVEEKLGNNAPSKRVPLKYIILYDKEALPYHLGYLDDYKKQINNSHYHYSFYDIVNEVRRNRFLGTSLKKFIK